MPIPIHVLIVEDSEDDTVILMKDLKRGGFSPEYQRVETSEAMRSALAEQNWDLIISDYEMPSFTGLSALNLMKQMERDIPFIIVSGNIGEETAVDAMKAGAHDYLRKGNMARLIPAIKRELQEAKNRREKHLAEAREQRSRIMIEAIASASLGFLETGSINTMAQILVDNCIAITKASFGFLYDVLPNGDARILAIAGSSDSIPESMAMAEEIKLTIKANGTYIIPQSRSYFFAPIVECESILLESPLDRYKWPDNGPDILPGISSFLASPLKTGHEVVGAIGLANRQDGFSDRERRELETFAQTAALAINSARTELERQHAMEHLRQAQKMEAIGQLAGGVAHDFNNLLTIINGYSTLIINSLGHDNPTRKEAEQILNAGERAADMTRQLLAFSRRQVLEMKNLSINSLVINLEKMLRRLIGEHIDLIANLANDIGIVRGDPGQIEQIILNLVVNARDAMERGGTITIETANRYLDEKYVNVHAGSSTGYYVMLAVHDTGSGMSDEVKRRIFEPYFTTKEPDKGTGLGLATVYGIVKQSGGYITVTSRQDNGTIFRVYLPKFEKAALTDTVITHQETPRGKETILVVEDKDAVLDLVADTLKNSGYHVLQTNNPNEAVQIFMEHGDSVDLLLTDVIMPFMSGKELAGVLSGYKPHLKVLFMSGYTDDTISREGILDDGVMFLPKPFSPDVLSRKIHDILTSEITYED